MSRKFFSLVKGEKIEVAPGAKFIPKDEFSELISAFDVSKEIQLELEQMRQEMAVEKEKAKQQGYKEGFEKGFQEWADKLSELEEEVKKVRGEVEKVIIPIALTAARKIVGKEMELHKDTISDIVAKTLKTVASHKKITIYANKKDIAVLENNKSKLKNIFENLESLSIRERDDINSGVVIETDRGIINAQLENQWTVLENAFKKITLPPKPPQAPVKAESSIESQEAPEQMIEEAAAGGLEPGPNGNGKDKQNKEEDDILYEDEQDDLDKQDGHDG